MSIDLVTFVAQLVNLAILIFLLYKLLYKPLLNAIDTREQRISNAVKKASDDMKKAEEKIKELEKKKADFEAERSEMLNKTYNEVADLRVQLEKNVRDEINQKRELFLNELEKERQIVSNELQTMFVDNFVAFSQKAMLDLANTDLESQIISNLDRKFEVLSEDERQKFFGKSEYIVTTKYSLNVNVKNVIEHFIVKKLQGTQGTIQYIQSDDILCGMSISSNGNELSWNLKEYLLSFSQAISEALKSISARRVQN
ncbi:MAG: hypothetical protein MJ250_03515 [Alphaproteobacteria bacterium]|nr:hypothetical protein [Alphaproteobacteria bacterium]